MWYPRTVVVVRGRVNMVYALKKMHAGPQFGKQATVRQRSRTQSGQLRTQSSWAPHWSYPSPCLAACSSMSWLAFVPQTESSTLSIMRLNFVSSSRAEYLALKRFVKPANEQGREIIRHHTRLCPELPYQWAQWISCTDTCSGSGHTVQEKPQGTFFSTKVPLLLVEHN